MCRLGKVQGRLTRSLYGHSRREANPQRDFVVVVLPVLRRSLVASGARVDQPTVQYLSIRRVDSFRPLTEKTSCTEIVASRFWEPITKWLEVKYPHWAGMEVQMDPASGPPHESMACLL